MLEEAYRMIGVRDGRREVKVPMAQAIVRALAVNAVLEPVNDPATDLDELGALTNPPPPLERAGGRRAPAASGI